MVWTCALLLLASIEFGVKAAFRWRTWRDRGLATTLMAAALAVVFLTDVGTNVVRLLDIALKGPGGPVLLPAVAFLAGLSGLNPFPFALLFGPIVPDRALTIACTLPLVLGALPHLLFQLWTMPPRRTRTDRKVSVNP